MSLSPAVLDALLAAGATAEMIVAAVKADGEQQEQRLREKRANDAARQRKSRASRNVTVTTCDSADAPSPSPSSSPDPSNNPTPAPVITHPASARARKAPACRLPEGWQPEPLTGEIGAAVAKWPPGALERELARFRDWAASAHGPNAMKSDWQAAWRNWVRKADDEGRYRGTIQRSGGQPSRTGDGFLNAINDAADRRRANDDRGMFGAARMG